MGESSVVTSEERRSWQAGRARWLRLSMAQREKWTARVFALPWVVGFIAFTMGPTLATLFFGFTKWELVAPPRWIGLANYQKMFFKDRLFWQAMKVSSLNSVGAVPLNLAFGMFLALLLNQKIEGLSFIRTVYYLPSQLAGVAVALLWVWIFHKEHGLLNLLLNTLVGIEGPGWLTNAKYVIPAFWVMSLWGVGGGMLIYLAGLQGIPTELYEAATVDGASAWYRFWHITIPMMTPIIFFNLVMGIIWSLQTFASAFIMTEGGPHFASLFYILYLYLNGFRMFHMGYACALAWVFFVYIIILTLVVVRSSAAWVYYSGSLKGR